MATEVDKQLAGEDWYHGLLPREDIKMLLQKNGDFIVRMTEPRSGQQRSFVLSMMHKEDRMEDGIKHYIITRKDSGKFMIEKMAFPSVSALVQYHLKTKESLVKTPVIIKTPIPRQDWEHNHEDVTLTKKLGEGAFGEVSLGRLTIHRGKLRGKTVEVAVKLAKLEALTKDQIKEIMGEARLMRRFDHPNVCRFYGVAAGSEPLMVIMELANDGALDSYLKKNTLPVEKLNEMVLQAAWGIEYIHAMNVLHRDIAARNCLYGDGNVKIADFGLSREGTSYQNEQHARVPIRWIAPETLTSSLFTQKTDVWAFGIMAWEIYNNGQEPYPGMSVMEVARSVLQDNYRMSFGTQVLPHVAEFFTQRVWHQGNNERATMSEVTRKLQAMFGITRPDFSSEKSGGNTGTRRHH